MRQSARLLSAYDKQYRIVTQSGDVIREMTGQVRSDSLLKASSDRLIYTIYKRGDSYFIMAKSLLMLTEQPIILENYNDITPVFIARKEQNDLFMKIIIFVGGLCALLNGILVTKFTQPIKELMNATQKITDGNMDIRVSVKNDDELSKLANNFNRMTDSLEEKMEELRDATRRQEDFVGCFTHEIKTPLTSIIGYADLLRSKKLDETTMFTSANYIFTEGKRLERLSFKLLELLVEGREELEYSNVSIHKIIEDAIDVLQVSLLEKEIEMIVDVKNVVVRVEKDLIKTVIINVIDNARKAVERKGTIVVKSKIHKNEVIVSITDNGRGIEKNNLNKITEAFYMVDKSRAREEGSAGLGLSICMKIMKFHHGEISFESELGKGTSVTLTLRGDN